MIISQIYTSYILPNFKLGYYFTVDFIGVSFIYIPFFRIHVNNLFVALRLGGQRKVCSSGLV